MKNKKIECHECGEETIIYDPYGEVDVENLKFCPHCGSTDNIEVTLEDI